MPDFVQTKKLNIAYEESGGGKPLILLYGWPDSSRAWNKVSVDLTQNGFRTIAPYLRGFGPTEFRDDSTICSGQIAALAQDAIDLLGALNIERVVVVGHDWRARNGYLLADLFPE